MVIAVHAHCRMCSGFKIPNKWSTTVRLTYILQRVGAAALSRLREAVRPSGFDGADVKAVHWSSVQVDGGLPAVPHAFLDRRPLRSPWPCGSLRCKSQRHRNEAQPAQRQPCFCDGYGHGWPHLFVCSCVAQVSASGAHLFLLSLKFAFISVGPMFRLSAANGNKWGRFFFSAEIKDTSECVFFPPVSKCRFFFLLC